ncbi:MAG: hypothetical protein Q8O76_01415, partial [Chloroflexota bacterium]|nr:hypothetical protein [Chloroflexota bacterium]
IQVFSFDELIDVIKALLYIKPPKGMGVGLIAMTGGQSVVVSDAFSRAGLSVPILTQGSYDELASFFNIIGGSYRNPLDISANFGSLTAVRRMLSILERDERVATVIMELSILALVRREQLRPGFQKELMELLARFHDEASKPFLMILSAVHLEAQALELRQQLMEKGIPSYPNFERGANALKKVADYYSRRWSGDKEDRA